MSDHGSDSGIDKDKTAIRPEPNDDKTIVRSEGSADGGHQQDARTASTSDEMIRRDPPREDATDKDAATVVRERTTPDPAQRDDGGATIVRQPSPSSQHATILRGSARAGDAASESDKGAAPPDEEAALQSVADDDVTIINQASAADSTALTGWTQQGTDTTYVATSGSPTPARGQSEAGRLLKNRFVLEEKIGSGGMGDVYKALDLRLQEARERNPYIAVKILNEHFARHKDAFISLQREATRTRGIPHQNIMAVYDFDREGDTVFMSMELLDGQPLDDYLKEHPEGVSVDDAWNIIDGICKGLSRAHGAGIVHSDFKPGNIYYTADKLAKVFDFGIARAVTSPEDLQADSETTLFDAGSLGALTPTYASYEMLTGQQPTKSDDVYAVALVAYELFTGRHPYDRTPADKALERGLEPAPVPFLKRRHWRALKKGLALKREDRYEDVDAFYAGMFSEDPPWLRNLAIAAVLLLSVGIGTYSFFHTKSVPAELLTLQGQMSADKDNLQQRLAEVAPDGRLVLDRAKWKFASQDWRGEIRQSLTRLRMNNALLRDKWHKPMDPAVDEWKMLVLDAYLAEVETIRKKVEGVKVRGDLKQQDVQVKDALASLHTAKFDLDIAANDYNFAPGHIADVDSRVVTAIQFREFQQSSIERNIKAAEERAAAAKAAEIARVQAEAARKLRDATYQADLNDFRHILRCKGDIPDADLVRLDQIINGPKGLRATFPAQFVVDKPGIVAALKGCIEQRIGARIPKRARMIKAKVMTYLPGEAALANIKIDDLDPCAARTLDGSGIRNGNWCSDRLAIGGLGPEMVVVPKSPPKIAHKFAISRIEIKVSDYNRFCIATGCQVEPEPGIWPVTDVSVKQAEAYASWLSDQTGHVYRLPTPAEWEYAARTDVNEPVDENVNCTVDSRGVRLGERLQSALSGRPNHWGLYNFVGNAREWAVASAHKIYVMGGAHTTPRSECTVDRMMPNTGKADDVTGFRLLRLIQD